MQKSLIIAMNKHINAVKIYIQIILTDLLSFVSLTQSTLQLEDLFKRLQDPTNGVSVEDRKYHLKVYPQTFIGRELVDWFVANRLFESREDAVEFGKVLVERGVIQHCTQGNITLHYRRSIMFRSAIFKSIFFLGHDFKDEYLFYIIMPAFKVFIREFTYIYIFI